ncbi:hypothetical protein FY534_12165 [Alicyclobacillus sp. TC]|uniref:hypothetical protein n=1 Tax=Alicyclobacillus sp. TC TaxID=2606450 RepID=UPI0019342D75|nr:hypothetical protein [Alicyclobacillus sp. TC]QRF24294.1 hypothetical protein FY534_12165 [Alicyclobacillus sp. TC]
MEDKKNGSWWSVLGILSLLIVPLICCGGPLIAGILGATGVGLFITGFLKNWLLAGVIGIVLVMGIVIFVKQRNKRKAACHCDVKLSSPLTSAKDANLSNHHSTNKT